MVKDRMNIYQKTKEEIPDYGSLFLVKTRQDNVNDYGGDISDLEKLDLITNAAVGSTCLFDDGSLYRKGIDGWIKIGGV